MDVEQLMNKIDDITSIDDDIQELIPYVQQCAKAYKWVRKKRLLRFLRTLDTQVGAWSEKDRDKFGKFVDSEIGQQLLADYSDTVLLTSSRIAQAALALLFADINNKNYTLRFKQFCCSALKGCSDQLIELFILLMELPLTRHDSNPYPVRFVKMQDEQAQPQLFVLVDSPADLFSSVNDLIQRGLLMPDHSSGRLGGEGWSCIFGVAEGSKNYLRLLSEAKKACQDS